MSGRPGQHLVLGGDFNVSLQGLTDHHHVGETENAVGHEQFTARESFAHCCGRAGLDGDEHLDGRRLRTRVIHTFQFVGPPQSLTQMDLIMSSRKLDMRRVQVLDSDWFKTDHRAVFAVLSLKTKMKYTVTSGANLRGWKPDDSWKKVAAETLTGWGNWNVLAPLLLETAKSHRKLETKEMSATELELKSLLLRKKRDGRQLGRTELNWLCRAMKERSDEIHLNKIKESTETEKAPKKTQSKHFNWSSIAKQENPENVLTDFFQDLSPGGPRRCHPIREAPLGRALEKT